jgi:hypothetical protein
LRILWTLFSVFVIRLVGCAFLLLFQIRKPSWMGADRSVPEQQPRLQDVGDQSSRILGFIERIDVTARGF